MTRELIGILRPQINLVNNEVKVNVELSQSFPSKNVAEEECFHFWPYDDE